eukprot:3050234-Prymnesium_polylepis.1
MAAHAMEACYCGFRTYTACARGRGARRQNITTIHRQSRTIGAHGCVVLAVRIAALALVASWGLGASRCRKNEGLAALFTID